MSNMTIEAFRATGRDCEDLGLALPGPEMNGIAGRLYYYDALWIQDTGERLRWRTMFAGTVFKSDDLAACEEWLYHVIAAGYPP